MCSRSSPRSRRSNFRDARAIQSPAVTAEPQFVRAAVLSEIDRIYSLQRTARATATPTTAKQRIAKIRALHDALFARRDEIRRALWDDYQKPPAEVDLSEIYP